MRGKGKDRRDRDGYLKREGRTCRVLIEQITHFWNNNGYFSKTKEGKRHHFKAMSFLFLFGNTSIITFSNINNKYLNNYHQN